MIRWGAFFLDFLCSFLLLGGASVMLYAGFNGQVHHVQCLVVNQTVVQTMVLEAINCHDVTGCYYGPCGYNVGPCCEKGQECTIEKLYSTTRSLLLEYDGTITDLEVIIKQRSNFTP
jgi:hypothetical protein